MPADQSDHSGPVTGPPVRTSAIAGPDRTTVFRLVQLVRWSGNWEVSRLENTRAVNGLQPACCVISVLSGLEI